MPEEKVTKSLCDERYAHIQESLARIEDAVNPHLPMLRQELENHIKQHKLLPFKIYVAIMAGVLAVALLSFILQRFG